MTRKAPTFFVRSPCALDAATRTAQIEEHAPQAKNSLDQIQRSTEDLKFGAAISSTLNNYHFPSDAAISAYFRVYLGQSRDDDNEEDDLISKVKRHLIDTINRKPIGIEENSLTNDRTFEAIAKDLTAQIDEASREDIPLVKLIVGPTGAGKTAFSKSLFSVCLRRFWNAKIVPSRVEFSKYRRGLHIPPNVSDYELDNAFFSFVRRCQFRDLLVYFLASGTYSYDERTSIISNLNLNGNAEREIASLLEATKDMVIDGEASRLNSKTRKIFSDHIAAMQGEIDLIIYKLAHRLKVRFLVSFDGFDSTRIEHFLFERREVSPIFYLVRTLKGIHEKVVFEGASRIPLETHYVCYLRDTTFARLRTDLVRSVGGSSSYPVQWIVPPPYPLLVHNAAVYLTKSHDPAENLGLTFSNDIASAFDRAVFDTLELNATTHLPFVFGSSGRRMKAHIRQVLISALHRATLSGEFDFSRFKGGVSPKIVWQELVRHHSVRSLPSYIIIEDLFLNESRQLTPKLELDPSVVTDKLNTSDFDGLLKHITDLDETAGTFGCLFNYFFQAVIEDEEGRQPALLIMIRIIQYVERNPRCLAAEIQDFLNHIGYDISERVCHFCLFVLIRTELIKWDASRGRRMIKDVPLYITATGRIAIEKLLFSITYVSEAILSAIMIDKELGDGLRARARENQVWIADCINNASIALYIIKEIEEIETRTATMNGVDLESYFLYGRLSDKLSREATAITRAGIRQTAARWATNVERLQRLRSRYQDLVILGVTGR